MAERQNEARNEDVSMLPNHQMGVNAVAGNQGGGPARSKHNTPVGLLNEIYRKGLISKPVYSNFTSEHGRTYGKIYTDSVSVSDMDLTETGNAFSKEEARHEAARRVLDKLRGAGERKEAFSKLTVDVVKKCYQMIQDCVLTEPKSEAESEEHFRTENLRNMADNQGAPRFAFEVVDESGPDHNNVMIFTVVCTQGGHVTRGTGPSKKEAKNKASSEMWNHLYKQS